MSNEDKYKKSKLGFFKQAQKRKNSDDTGEGDSGSGGGSEGIAFDWSILTEGGIDCPIGPNERQTKHGEILPYSMPAGVKDLVQQKDTYKADKAKTAISKGDRSSHHMYNIESQNEMENGPQNNPRPLV